MAPGAAAACLLPPASYELRTFQKLKVETTRHAIVEIGELTWNINVSFFDHLDIFLVIDNYWRHVVYMHEVSCKSYSDCM